MRLVDMNQIEILSNLQEQLHLNKKNSSSTSRKYLVNLGLVHFKGGCNNIH